MEKYLKQLYEDIALARKRSRMLKRHTSFALEFLPFAGSPTTEKVKTIEEWMGIPQEALPPADALDMHQLDELRRRLLWMLSAWCCHLEFDHYHVPEYLQYKILRAGWKQKAPLGQGILFYFHYCDDDTTPGKCLLGEYCDCIYREPPEEWPYDEEE
jgi:hypothetical protein